MTRAQQLSLVLLVLTISACLASTRKPRGAAGVVPEEPVTFCDQQGFNFFNGFNQPENSTLTYVLWDFNGEGFDDGSNDAFDTFLWAMPIVNTSSTTPSFQRLDYNCGADNSTAWYLYNFPTFNLHLTRHFWVPQDPNINWARVVDKVTNNANESTTVNILYKNNLGSDGTTTFAYRTTYSFVSHDDEQSDPPVGTNFGNQDGAISANSIKMVTASDNPSWIFTFELAAGASASIMTIVSQSAFVEDALAITKHLETTPAIITQDLEEFPSILNWDLCGAVFTSSQSDICSTPATVQVEGTYGFELSIKGTNISFTPQTSPFNVTLPSGTHELTYQRHASCTKRTHQLSAVEAPDANLSVEISTDGTWPTAQASGGYGSYVYSWTTETQNLKGGFGKNAVLTVTDVKGCSISKQVMLPEVPSETGKAPTVSSAHALSALSAVVIGLVASALM